MNVKKLVIILVVALALFYLISDPNGSAGAVHNVLGWLENGAHALITFVKSLFA